MTHHARTQLYVRHWMRRPPCEKVVHSPAHSAARAEEFCYTPYGELLEKWKVIAPRKIFFLHANAAGRVPVKELVASETVDELRQPADEAFRADWFSPQVRGALHHASACKCVPGLHCWYVMLRIGEHEEPSMHNACACRCEAATQHHACVPSPQREPPVSY